MQTLGMHSESIAAIVKDKKTTISNQHEFPEKLEKNKEQGESALN